jgi:branched-chain amino acid aminotransferase
LAVLKKFLLKTTVMDIYYVDGEYVAADEASIPVDDLAVLRGYGVFDFLRTYGGKPFFLKEHLERLARSASLIGLDCSWTLDELVDIVMETLRQNQHDESNIRIVLTGGSSDDFITPQGRSRLIIMVTPLFKTPPWWYTNGVKIITVSPERYIPDAKSINYIPAAIALKKASRQNAVEAVYVDRDGSVLEGTTTNLFTFIDDKLVTPSTGILAGITRQVILMITDGIYDTEIRVIKMDRLLQASEVFLTASNKEIVPVIQVNDTLIGNGRPGQRTRHLMDIFAEYTAKFAATRR